MRPQAAVHFEVIDLIGIEQLNSALYTFNNQKIGLGYDGISLRFLKLLPLEGTQEFANLLNATFAVKAWAWQLLVGKPS